MVPELTDGARGRGAEALGWQWLVDWFAVPRGRAAIAISTLTMGSQPPWARDMSVGLPAPRPRSVCWLGPGRVGGDDSYV